MDSSKFDLIVIGSGPAGEKGAAQAAYFGKSVALIEKEPELGGAAANTGTLPSKTLRETALFLSGFRNRDLSGVNLSIKHQVTIRDFLVHEQHVTQEERVRILDNLSRHHVQLFRGTGSFVDAHTISIRSNDGSETRIQGDVVLIAVGSSPFRPPIYPFEDPRVWDSDTILQLQHMPKSMLVVGGGVIGCEYACMFAILGIEVTVVEQRGRAVGSLDAEIAASLQSQMESIGIRFLFNDSVESVHAGEEIDVQLKSGLALKPGAILVSSGRNGNTHDLGLDRVGVVVNERGVVNVNARYQTEAPHVYAAGDVIGSPALASTAMEQARVAMVNAFDLKYKSDMAVILPYGIYTIPECSMAGETEESLKKKGIDYVVGKATYDTNARGHIIGDDKGFLKLLFATEDMRLLGVHIIGEQATELVHVGLTALLLKQGADLFIQTCYNYPTLTELYKYATYDALGRRAAQKK
ncbi:Si-specific NAD(P)(+) transhydrogenase [Singulisphaera acidiphila]|uniref:Soluble pyridine nucleotide transhydrogenase n=1 Tax=Singulisphaera acidiphila (strain ATCC BAA-1392 / DSM 18658 / VKM B-2454 / MOB10) TaxID=886293 RepID=L0DD99_SINAD|nr:Si-specific NAD(P)(+) transhydrogenase [Singulisphaera acidiphila]AGA27339.1 pyruvate/2-oxoglutarate dehydrogenase complex, dihydrolipoamide dehydrogenase component [Singulisphaera acidiphila DSM 18658]